MKELHVVGGALFEGQRVLAAQRSESMSLPLKWEFPGGKVEPDESPRQSLRRELQEELGVIVEVGELIGTGRAPAGERVVRLDVYRCRLIEGSPVAREHAELRWVPLEALASLDWAAADVPIVENLLASVDE